MADRMNEAIHYHIRPATAADSALIKAAIRQARLDPTNLNWQNFKVAEADAGDERGQMIGLCQVRRYWGVRELGSLYVREQYRSQGIGAALVRACLAGETPPVHLECLDLQQRYYEGFGFRRIPIRQAPMGLRLKASLGTVMSRLVVRRRIVVMRWDG